MLEENKKQERAKLRSRLWAGLAVWLMLLVGLIALCGCSKNGASPSVGTVVKNSSGMEFAYVPAGSFQLGAGNGDPNEQPVHQVTFARGFYMGRYEVTQAQWQKVMGNNPSTFSSCTSALPNAARLHPTIAGKILGFGWWRLRGRRCLSGSDRVLQTRWHWNAARSADL